MADQLQTNYASDLRSILKTLFEVMATKQEADDKEKLKKGEACSDYPIHSLGWKHVQVPRLPPAHLREMTGQVCSLHRRAHIPTPHTLAASRQSFLPWEDSPPSSVLQVGWGTQPTSGCGGTHL